MMRAYQQLTCEQRCQISALKKSGCSQRKIAETIGTTQSTVSRELARITVIDSELRVESSPEQISGWLLYDQELLISHESIYLHIWADKHAGGDLYTYLRHQCKKYNKRRNGKSTRGQIRNRVSLDDRTQVVDDKSRIGDWEIDTIIGKGHSGALVTIAERVTKLTVSTRVNSKSAADVTQATIALLKPFEDIVHTITADNGKEFAYREPISKALSTEVYFAYPYSSWERGLNENTNGLLRQYLPKNTDFKKVEQVEVRRALRRLNSRPRIKTPAQLMDGHRAALAA